MRFVGHGYLWCLLAAAEQPFNFNPGTNESLSCNICMPLIKMYFLGSATEQFFSGTYCNSYPVFHIRLCSHIVLVFLHKFIQSSFVEVHSRNIGMGKSTNQTNSDLNIFTEISFTAITSILVVLVCFHSREKYVSPSWFPILKDGSSGLLSSSSIKMVGKRGFNFRREMGTIK